MHLAAEQYSSGAELPEARSEAEYDAFARASHWRSLALALVKASRDCVNLVDLDGLVVAANPAGLRLLQIDDPATLVGQSWASRWAEPERSLVGDSVERGRAGELAHFRGFCATAEGRAALVGGAGRARGRRGRRRAMPARDLSRRDGAARARAGDAGRVEAPAPGAAVAVGRFRRQLAQAARRGGARVSHDDRLRLFGRFVGGVVHDFNNVFAAMHGAARLLRRRVTDTSALDVVSHVERAAERGAALARQLLDFARSDSETAEVFDPAALLLRDAHLLRHIVSGEATLAVAVAAGRLAGAGLAAAVPVGAVQPRRQRARRDPRARPGRGLARQLPVADAAAGARRAGDYVLLTVTDNGCGMSPDALRRAGEPFFTTKPPARARGSASPPRSNSPPPAAGGRSSRARRASARGSASICAARRSRARLSARPTPPSIPALHGGAKLLLVEDDPLTRDHLASVFRDLNYVVVEASAYEIAAATAEEGDFDLVVTDLNLKDGLGDRLVAELRIKQPALPAIYVTGSSGLTIPRDETVLRKPVSETRLARAVLEKLGRLPGAAASADALRQVERIAGGDPRPRDEARDRRLARPFADASPHSQRVRRAGPWSAGAAAARLCRRGWRWGRSGAAFRAGRFGAFRRGSDGRCSEPCWRRETSRRSAMSHAPCVAGSTARRATITRASPLGDGKVSLVERLLLPLGDAEGRVGHLFGLVAFNEAST